MVNFAAEISISSSFANRNDELRHPDALAQEPLREVPETPVASSPKNIIGHQSGPQIPVQPTDIVRGGQGLLQRLRIAFRKNGALLFADLFVRQHSLGGTDCFLMRRPANYTQPETDFDSLFSKTTHQSAEFLWRINQPQPAGAVVRASFVRPECPET